MKFSTMGEVVFLKRFLTGFLLLFFFSWSHTQTLKNQEL